MKKKIMTMLMLLAVSHDHANKCESCQKSYIKTSTGKQGNGFCWKNFKIKCKNSW